MKAFTDERGNQWVATARKEQTPRHHGIWYMVLHPDGEPDQFVAIPEIRWQTAATAARTIRTMSDPELRRRLESARTRNTQAVG